MKNIIIIFLLFHTTCLLSQERISIDVFLGLKTTGIDNEYQSQQKVINTLTNFSLQLKETDFGHFFIGQSLEYANLQDGPCYRYAFLQIGYSFSQPILLRKMTANVAVNYAITRRWSEGFNSYGGTFDLSYKFSDSIKLASLIQMVRRTDIENHIPNGHNIIYEFNFFVGIKIDLFRVRNIF